MDKRLEGVDQFRMVPVGRFGTVAEIEIFKVSSIFVSKSKLLREALKKIGEIGGVQES